jgi:hypothetical protein
MKLMRPPSYENVSGTETRESGEAALEAGDQIDEAAETGERSFGKAVELGGGVDAVRVSEEAVATPGCGMKER